RDELAAAARGLDADAAAELAAGAWRVWMAACDVAGGRAFLAGVLDRPGAARSRWRALALYGDGLLAYWQGEIGVSRARDEGALTDGVSLVYLADVYVLPEYRGRGLGVELVREMVERGPYADIRWVLHTRDAHRLYGKFRFGGPSERLMERYRRD